MPNIIVQKFGGTSLGTEERIAAVAKIAKEANVGKLLIGHYSGRYKDISEFKKEAKEVFLNSEVTEAGEVFSID